MSCLLVHELEFEVELYVVDEEEEELEEEDVQKKFPLASSLSMFIRFPKLGGGGVVCVNLIRSTENEWKLWHKNREMFVFL